MDDSAKFAPMKSEDVLALECILESLHVMEDLTGYRFSSELRESIQYVQGIEKNHQPLSRTYSDAINSLVLQLIEETGTSSPFNPRHYITLAGFKQEYSKLGPAMKVLNRRAQEDVSLMCRCMEAIKKTE